MNHLTDEVDAQQRKGSKNATTAKMPVAKNAITYKMNHLKRGTALIFNHEYYNLDLTPRKGTKVDTHNLDKTFSVLGFDVKIYNDLRYAKIEEVVQKAANADHSESDCIVLVFLTHGDTGGIYAYDGLYKPEILYGKLTADKCPSLAGKPKIVFIQACRGENTDAGVRLVETDGEQHGSYKIPIQADFLIVRSTVFGYVSWRNPVTGSWFIENLCKKINELADEYDLMTILTFVNHDVAFNCESNNERTLQFHQKKQIPCIISMLTRLIKF